MALVGPVQGQRLSETVLTRQQFPAVLPVTRDEVHFVAVYVGNVCVPISVAVHGDGLFDVMGLCALEAVFDRAVVGHADERFLGGEEQQDVTRRGQGDVFGGQGEPDAIQANRAQHLGKKVEVEVLLSFLPQGARKRRETFILTKWRRKQLSGVLTRM